MKKTALRSILAATLLLSAGCAAFQERHTEANPQMRFMEQRVETVAKQLVRDGKAATYEEALPLAREIVAKEQADQKAAARDNERGKDYFREHSAGTPRE
ncbi:MAG TPA: hypothetical protein PKI32_00720 [Opitutales bacterium]|nr:hypothetical protein [Opitutales bacterium]